MGWWGGILFSGWKSLTYVSFHVGPTLVTALFSAWHLRKTRSLQSSGEWPAVMIDLINTQENELSIRSRILYLYQEHKQNKTSLTYVKISANTDQLLGARRSRQRKWNETHRKWVKTYVERNKTRMKNSDLHPTGHGHCSSPKCEAMHRRQVEDRMDGWLVRRLNYFHFPRRRYFLREGRHTL